MSCAKGPLCTRVQQVCISELGSHILEPGQSPSTTGTCTTENIKTMQPNNPEFQKKKKDSNSGYKVKKTEAY